MTSESQDRLGPSVTPADITAWREEMTQIDTDMRKLESRKALLVNRITAANTLFALLDDPLEQSAPMAPPAARTRNGKITFVEAVKNAVHAAPEGWLSLRGLRKTIEAGELGSRLQESDKGYYHAITRLTERGELMRNGQWLLEPDREAVFLSTLKRGEINESDPYSRDPMSKTGSRMGDKIVGYIALMGPKSPNDLLAYLRKTAEFSKVVNKNASSAYNVISRLHTRGQLVKTDGLYDIPENVAAKNKIPSPAITREGNLFN